MSTGLKLWCNLEIDCYIWKLCKVSLPVSQTKRAVCYSMIVVDCYRPQYSPLQHRLRIARVYPKSCMLRYIRLAHERFSATFSLTRPSHAAHHQLVPTARLARDLGDPLFSFAGVGKQTHVWCAFKKSKCRNEFEK
jgi:hypothetical protein